MKIEFGCGENPTKEGFKTCDIRNLPKIDFVCEAWKIDEFISESTVEEIFSRHFFEHLTFAQGEKLLDSWYKILKPDGIVEMLTPNMTYHFKQWINRSSEKEFNHAKAGLWGWQRGTLDETWDIHKSGYDYDSLSKLLIKKKFKNIKLISDVDSMHLHVTFTK
jgi:predicted SAM-dependent methyltransferase